jgi:hypothetical protein
MSKKYKKAFTATFLSNSFKSNAATMKPVLNLMELMGDMIELTCEQKSENSLKF